MSSKWKTSDTVGVVLLAPITVASMWLRGWAMVRMWDWFAIPIGAPHVPMLAALGLALLVSLITTKPDLNIDSDKTFLDRLLQGFVFTILATTSTVAFGKILIWLGAP